MGTRHFGERGSESKHHQRSIAVGQWSPKGTKRSLLVQRFGLWACILACWLVQDGKAGCLAAAAARCAPQLTGSSAAGIIGAGGGPGGALESYAAVSVVLVSY
jgi:hypothetical protein